MNISQKNIKYIMKKINEKDDSTAITGRSSLFPQRGKNQFKDFIKQIRGRTGSTPTHLFA